MTQALARIDAWCRHGDFTLEDLAWFRIIFAGGLLISLQQIGWMSGVPTRQFDPPPGPVMLLDAMPPQAALEALEITTAVLTAFLLIGLRTRVVSVLLAGALLAGFGLLYSLGRIDHTIVLILVPATMAFSRWGEAMSVDAGTSRRMSSEQPVPQWPMRLLAVLVALSFVTAGWAKIRSGWLDLGTHAVQGHVVRGYHTRGRTDWLASQAVDFQVGWLWEAADWFTVILEIGLVLAVLSWRWFRIAVAVAALFHVGVLLLMNIVFSWNLLGYAAFVRWGTILPSVEGPVRLGRILGPVVGLVLGVGVYVLHEWAGPDLQIGGRIFVVFVGGAVGAAHLVLIAVRAASRSQRQPA